ncbi:hypothetical protein C6988_08210 [Nitrosopumilus sp. b1]|uniref:hypothetical protein n=1 Tax=Nitrosopumilus sp. b1 TaxID=2109907 RepID=UPI0015F36297|nr:hypothetical protein [Nitrosopumilus sp. b1]KAF6242638.1 hypothetical protein C6988_08210 [Nitrosopumilus sp. b1]
MRDEQRFEIERAFDLLPHVVGSSWAVIFFRLNGIKNPTREEYHKKVVEYFNELEPLFLKLPNDEKFQEMKKYIQNRTKIEIDKIMKGENKEVEKRYDRYVDYG